MRGAGVVCARSRRRACPGPRSPRSVTGRCLTAARSAMVCIQGRPDQREVRPSMTSADIVVAGAGHNSLLAACYLAKAGYRCLVLDARSIPGGGAATEELLLPGFGIDTCATGHTIIRVNPALLHDELGLIADYGLRYVQPDPVEQVAFPDGEQ